MAMHKIQIRTNSPDGELMIQGQLNFVDLSRVTWRGEPGNSSDVVLVDSRELHWARTATGTSSELTIEISILSSEILDGRPDELSLNVISTKADAGVVTIISAFDNASNAESGRPRRNRLPMTIALTADAARKG